jgi:hypothetical protein
LDWRESVSNNTDREEFDLEDMPDPVELKALELPAIFVDSYYIAVSLENSRISFAETGYGNGHPRMAVVMPTRYAIALAHSILDLTRESKEDEPAVKK